MNEYFQYFNEMIKRFFVNLGEWFYNLIVYPWTKVPADFQEYGDLYNTYSPGFGGVGWFFYVLFAIILLALIGGIIFFGVLLFKKYAKFYKSERTKDQLRKEVEKLNYELYMAINEKNRILNLKVESMGLDPKQFQSGNPEEEKAIQEVGDVRFPKLCAVDKKYEGKDLNVVMTEANKVSLEELCVRFRNFACSQLNIYYDLDTVRAVFAGMGTSKILILEGISGTGKTSLPYCLGRFFRNNAKICSVQPSWRDRSELLGYYNEFTKKFSESDFLKGIYESTYRKDVSLIVLDEMNLARIEYYFAEFLSIMEMPNSDEWNIELVAQPRSDDPKHVKDGKLLIPQNVWFIGTANNDDSTFTITDKVYDRSISVFLNDKGRAFDAEFTESMEVSFDYLSSLFQEAKTNYPISPQTMDKFKKLDDFVISKFRLTFGNRIMKQLDSFVPCYVATGASEYDGVDYIFSTKILKKFESLNIAFLKDELLQLDAYLTKLFGKTEFKLSRRTIQNLLKMAG